MDQMTETDLEQAIVADPNDPNNDPSYWETTSRSGPGARSRSLREPAPAIRIAGT